MNSVKYMLRKEISFYQKMKQKIRPKDVVI